MSRIQKPRISTLFLCLLAAVLLTVGIGAAAFWFLGQSSVTDLGEKEESFEYLLAGEKKQGRSQVLTWDLGAGVTMEFVRIKAGKFQMGSPDSDKDASDDEKPPHEVEITQDFYMGKYPVTQEQYQAVMGKNPSYFSATGPGPGKDAVAGRDTRRFPVECVTCDEAEAFCKRLSEKAHRTVVLPTEAQREYACRAGTTTRFYCGDALTAKDVNFNVNFISASAVGSYPANPWGLYDMHGYVREWCADYYDASYYKNSASNKDPVNLIKTDARVLRGGSWYNPGQNCAYRRGVAPGGLNWDIGFRVTSVVAPGTP